MLSIVAWVAAISLLYFFIMKKTGLLRVPLLEEVIGLDFAEMGSKVKVDMKIAEGITRAQTLRFHKEKSGATRQMDPGAPPGNPASVSVPPGMLSGVPGTSDPKEEAPMMLPTTTSEADL